MSLEDLNKQIKKDLSYLSFGGANWVPPIHQPNRHVYDVVIVGGGQSGLAAAFGLLKERISNILVIDENPKGYEGPWATYARMVTLRTPKHLTSVDLGIPSLTFRSWWEAQFGEEGWDHVDKIPRVEWMNYLRWYRNVLNLPVLNEVKLTLVEPSSKDIHHLRIEGKGAPSNKLYARKVIFATGIQGGGEWHVPPIVSKKLPKSLYAHSSEQIKFDQLIGKKIAILGGGASAFDNAYFALSSGVAEAHVFVRRKELPRVNPIRQMEISGMIERFHSLSDEEKYRVISHFFKHNQPPTNDTFRRASSHPGFTLQLSSPWLDVEVKGNGVNVTTPNAILHFDYLLISTGLLTDPALRPELRLLEKYIARWGDCFHPSENEANPVLNAHPYLSPGFAFKGRNEKGKQLLHGLFAFNYSALISCGISASALSGMRIGIPKLVSAVADQLFTDNKDEILHNYYNYHEAEFIGESVPNKELVVTSQHHESEKEGT